MFYKPILFTETQYEKIFSTSTQKSNDGRTIQVEKNKVIEIFRKLELIAIDDEISFEALKGNDIDSFIEKRNIEKIYSLNYLVKKEDGNNYRIFINQENGHLVCIDIEVFEKQNQVRKESIVVAKSGLRHLDKFGLTNYKYSKYFIKGLFHSLEQFHKLWGMTNQLTKSDKTLLLDSFSDPLTKVDVQHFIKTGVVVDRLQQKLVDLRNDRNFNRNAFRGFVNPRSVFRKPKFWYALIFGSFGLWVSRSYPLTAICLIGNDGCGKTTLSHRLVNEKFKLDPIHVDMKGENPMFKSWGWVRKQIKKQIKLSQFAFYRVFLRTIGEFGDFCDKYVRYRIGMAWADSGLGFTIFERYPTDRVRGEYPSKHFLLPIEQFFPFPDTLVYLDIPPLESLNRKSQDGHSYEEMHDKRKNYQSLLKEISNTHEIKFGCDVNDNLKKVTTYLYASSLSKQKKISFIGKNKRAIWSKSRNRVLSQLAQEKKQK
jgi:hypothetical protein